VVFFLLQGGKQGEMKSLAQANQAQAVANAASAQ
jgi:hypothetical protein